MFLVCIKGVISTVPGSVWFGSVRNRSDFDASGSVNRKRVYTVRLATEVNRACEQVHFAVQYGGTCLYAKVWAEK